MGIFQDEETPSERREWHQGDAPVSSLNRRHGRRLEKKFGKDRRLLHADAMDLTKIIKVKAMHIIDIDCKNYQNRRASPPIDEMSLSIRPNLSYLQAIFILESARCDFSSFSADPTSPGRSLPHLSPTPTT